MKINLTEKDIKLITFLGKYKIIKSVDSKKIYNSKGYYLKRLKVLEKEGYIKREDYYYIKLDVKGKKLVRKLGYSYNESCRNKEYKNRMKGISKIAAITLNNNVKFIPSWSLKNNEIFTETSRRYIGEGRYKNRKYLVYYIDKTRDWMYERQIIGDIRKTAYYNDFIIFLDNLDRVNKRNYYFTFGKNNIYLITDKKENFENIQRILNIDFYEILSNVYKSELLLSDFIEADYMLNKYKYIVIMPFINTERLHRIKLFLRNNKNSNKEIDIITLKENKDKINEILKRKCNILDIDKFMEERMKKFKVRGKIPLFFLITYILLTPIICWYYNKLNEYMNFSSAYVKIDNLLEIWSVGFSNVYIIFAWSVISIIILSSYKLIKVTIENSKIETEGIKYKDKDGTYGTADWANREEIEDFLSVGKRDGIIIGETEENQLITLHMDTYLNKNIAVFGASGSRKISWICYSEWNGVSTI